MPDMQVLAAQRKLANAEKVGNNPDQIKRLKARVSELESVDVSASSKKADLLATAQARGLDVDESMTKAEILEALEE